MISQQNCAWRHDKLCIEKFGPLTKRFNYQTGIDCVRGLDMEKSSLDIMTQYLIKVLLENIEKIEIPGIYYDRRAFTNSLSFNKYFFDLLREFTEACQLFDSQMYHKYNILNTLHLGYFEDIIKIIHSYINLRTIWASNIAHTIKYFINSDLNRIAYLLPSARNIIKIVTLEPACHLNICEKCLNYDWCDWCRKHVCALHKCGQDICIILHKSKNAIVCNFCKDPLKHNNFIGAFGRVLDITRPDGTSVTIEPKKLWNRLCKKYGNKKQAIEHGYHRKWHCMDEILTAYDDVWGIS